MCVLYLYVFPSLPKLNYCCILSEKYTHGSCVTRCGDFSSKKFKFQTGTFQNWLPSYSGSTEREELGMHWPITSVCEGT